MKNRNTLALSFALIVTTMFAPLATYAAEEVNLYSARKEKLIKPLLDIFTKDTGIKVNLVTAKAGPLLKRLQTEGINSPADLFITTDAGRLHKANEAGVLQVTQSEILNAAIPAEYRDPAGVWYGLSLRARPIFYIKAKVKPEELSSYEDLANDKWKNRICIRGSSNIYNQSLVASMIANSDAAKTQDWANKFVSNFARKPKGGDRDQIKAAAAGECDIAIANTYYFGKMIHGKDEAQKKAADAVAIFWPNQADRGTHVNISGIAMTKAAKNTANAQKLMEFLVSKPSQEWYAQVNYEYPVIASAEWSDTLKGWGEFKADSLNLAKLGELNKGASQLMDKAKWK